MAITAGKTVLVSGKTYPLGVEYRKRLLYAMEFVTFNAAGQVNDSLGKL